MSETKCCGNCKHFKDEDIYGCGFYEVVDDIVVSRESCEEHCYYHNGWAEITPDNVEELYDKPIAVAWKYEGKPITVLLVIVLFP